MSELDAYLGYTKKKAEMPEMTKHLDDWRCEESLKPLLNAFLEGIRDFIKIPDFTFPNKRSWYASCRETIKWLDSYKVPEDKYLSWVNWGLSYHRSMAERKGIDFIVKTSRSIHYTIAPYAKQLEKEDRYRYLKGLEE